MAIKYLSDLNIDGEIAMGTNKITGLGDPSAAQDAATKNYVDSISVGVTEVDANSTKNGLTLTTSPSTGITSTGSVVLAGTLQISNDDCAGAAISFKYPTARPYPELVTLDGPRAHFD